MKRKWKVLGIAVWFVLLLILGYFIPVLSFQLQPHLGPLYPNYPTYNLAGFYHLSPFEQRLVEKIWNIYTMDDLYEIDILWPLRYTVTGFVVKDVVYNPDHRIPWRVRIEPKGIFGLPLTPFHFAKSSITAFYFDKEGLASPLACVHWSSIYPERTSQEIPSPWAEEGLW